MPTDKQFNQVCFSIHAIAGFLESFVVLEEDIVNILFMQQIQKDMEKIKKEMDSAHNGPT